MLTSKNCLVSIIMPCKNAGAFLHETIDSIIKQSYSNWELIVVNDHSTDNSFEILNIYSKKYSNIKVLTNHGKGIIDALKTAYKESKGELITRMDADDIMAPSKLQLMVETLIINGKGKIATGLVKYFSEDELGNGYKKYEEWLNGLTQSNTNYTEIYKECSIPSPCWMLWKEDFENCGGFNSNVYPEDYDLVFRFYQNNLKVIGIHQILHYWRDHTNRTSRNDENYADNNFIGVKIMYFIKIDYQPKKKLILWGAGKKGKQIAKLLVQQNIPFDWICNTTNKIGHNIYSKQLLDASEKKFENCQVIIAVANIREQNEIKNKLNSIFETESYYFC